MKKRMLEIIEILKSVEAKLVELGKRHARAKAQQENGDGH